MGREYFRAVHPGYGVDASSVECNVEEQEEDGSSQASFVGCASVLRDQSCFEAEADEITSKSDD